MSTMNINHAEFLLLSRTGRGPYTSRAGPQPFELAELQRENSSGLPSRHGRTGLTLRRRRGRRLLHALGLRGRGSAPAARTLEYGDGKYFEMEFAVGFPAEEETLL
jgi:hypothetical protein